MPALFPGGGAQSSLTRLVPSWLVPRPPTVISTWRVLAIHPLYPVYAHHLMQFPPPAPLPSEDWREEDGRNERVEGWGLLLRRRRNCKRIGWRPNSIQHPHSKLEHKQYPGRYSVWLTQCFHISELEYFAPNIFCCRAHHSQMPSLQPSLQPLCLSSFLSFIPRETCERS